MAYRRAGVLPCDTRSIDKSVGLSGAVPGGLEKIEWSNVQATLGKEVRSPNQTRLRIHSRSFVTLFSNCGLNVRRRIFYPSGKSYSTSSTERSVFNTAACPKIENKHDNVLFSSQMYHVQSLAEGAKYINLFCFCFDSVRRGPHKPLSINGRSFITTSRGVGYLYGVLSNPPPRSSFSVLFGGEKALKKSSTSFCRELFFSKVGVCQGSLSSKELPRKDHMSTPEHVLIVVCDCDELAICYGRTQKKRRL